MFTGLIDAVGIVVANHVRNKTNQLIIQSPYDDLIVGESIAVNGVCLTVLPYEGDKSCLVFDVSVETISVTNIGRIKPGQVVNLERAMRANARFGGHYVSGHIDTTAQIQAIDYIDDCVQWQLGGFKNNVSAYVLTKASICLDGVSLTINEVIHSKTELSSIKLLLIPHTLAQTTLQQLTIHSVVNVEFDYLTRVVAHQVNHQLAMLGLLKSEM